MQKFSRSWDTKTRIEYLQRRIIIASYLYYEKDWSPIDDWTYEELSKQLMDLMQGFDIALTHYGYVFTDYDGSTGFDLFYKLNEEDKEHLTYIANIIYEVKHGTYLKKPVEQKKTTTKKRRLF